MNPNFHFPRACAAAVLSYIGMSCAAETNLFTSIKPDFATGPARAAVVNPAPLFHTTQIFPADAKGDLVAQTQQALKELGAVLKSAQSSLEHIVKLNIYVARAELTPAVQKVLARQFTSAAKPAVSFVGGEQPQPGVLVTMDDVAVSKMKTSGHAVPLTFGKNKRDSFASAAVLPPSDAIYVAGMADKAPLAEATRNTLEKLLGAIGHFELAHKDIVQLKAFVTPMSEAETVREEIRKFFQGKPVPPLVLVEWVSSSVPVEIELIAAAPKTTNASDTISYHTPPGTTSAPVYSRVARIHGGRRIYVSGLCGQSEQENDVKEIFAELTDLVKQNGSDFNHLVKATYYYSDPSANKRLDAFRPTVFDPKRPPAASKARVPDAGFPGKGITLDMIAVSAP